MILPGERRSTGPGAAPVAAVLLGLLLLCVSTLPACGEPGDHDGAGSDAAPVVATTSILADIVDHATCGRLDVPSIIPQGADAHEYEISTRDADRIRGAQLVVANGLGLEDGLSDSLEAARSDGVAVEEIGPRVHPLGSDPHVWMDPDRMATAVGLIADWLADVDDLGIDATTLRSCATTYADELTSLGAEMDATLAVVPASRRKLVTNHEALGYFADRFDFEVVGAVIPSLSSLGESNARDFDALAAAMEREGVTTVFAETSRPRQLSDRLAEAAGSDVDVVELYTETLGPADGEAGTYAGMMRTDARRIAESLSRSTSSPGSGR
jgi:zinc/manganese transport system substrate-binding protein